MCTKTIAGKEENRNSGKLTVSIVVHDTAARQLIKSLSCLLRGPVEKIYVIDNSRETSLEDVATNFPKVEYIHVKNEGFGAGHNIGIHKSIEFGADYHLVMNADVWWKDDIINPILNFMAQNKEVGLLAPRTYYPDGELQYTCRKLPTPADLFIKRFLPSKIKKGRMKRYLLEEHDHDFSLNSPYLLGSFLFFRVEALKEKGIFDERFFMYPEDIDITRRIHEKYKTLYWPEVSIVHEHQAASRRNMRMFYIHLVNMMRYFNKWGWITDRKRAFYNKILMESIVRIPQNKIQKGRG